MNNDLLLDRNQLKEMEDLLGENFRMLLDIFLRDSQNQAANICSWQDVAQKPVVQMAAHTLKSSAANLGLNKLANRCDAIESACHEDRISEIPDLVSGMKSLYDDSIARLQEETTALT